MKEVAVSFKTNPAGACPVDGIAGEEITSVGGGLRAEHNDSAEKEAGISFPSKIKGGWRWA